jgi:hypothetical protein
VVNRVEVLAAVLTRDTLVLVGRVFVARAELVLRVAAMVAIAARPNLRNTVLRTFAVDRILVTLAPLTAHAAVLVQRIFGTELRLRVAMMVSVTRCQKRCGTVLRALVVNGVGSLGTKSARNAGELKAVDLGTELSVRVTLVVLVAVGTQLCDAVLGTFAVDSVFLVAAVVAGHTRIQMTGLFGTELGSTVAVIMLTALGAKRWDAVERAVLIDGVLVVLAVLARDAGA